MDLSLWEKIPNDVVLFKNYNRRISSQPRLVINASSGGLPTDCQRLPTDTTPPIQRGISASVRGVTGITPSV
ncbi:hypothetical protein K1T71_001869 [Dendrolimus kikuchii]|uniref:Uncharacterized protein n=1 Tax=Dendrolimus kikuchii TaxID=765133 RepID=A0ACC1DFC4_9NEOP|nr:hypothetical protein K1T71_001869 [Dendrolimus kikuchii]